MYRSINKSLITAAALALCLSLASTALAQHGDSTETKSGDMASLYERLGGVYSIATVVDDFVERVLVNDVLNANPLIDAARTTVPKAGLKFRITALVCQLTGGPEVYNGRNMIAAHAHLNINEAQWDAMVSDFVATLNHFEVPEKEQGELMALVGPTKGDIVTAKE